jgi:WD40 repeat protein/DNA-binding SARP family transcriptional activator
MAHLSLSLLGPFRATLAGEPVTGFESNKVRALLAYLSVEADRPHRRESLAALLWPDWPDRAAHSNLRHALANLRKAIGDRQATPPFLLITRETIQFNTASDYWLDVAAFKALVEADQAGQFTSHQLEEAVALYRGSFLEGFSLKDSPAFEDWSLLTRERLQRQALAALHQLAGHYEQRGEYERACEVAWRQVELEPWDEEVHQQLMRALALSGQRSAALAQYDTCCRLLKQELGVEPSRETTALYESIRDETLLPVSTTTLAEEPPVPGKPPFKGLHYFDEADADLFFGREGLTAKLVGRVRECLSPGAGGGRFLTVIGASGSGKSSIVRAGLVPALKRGEPLADGSLPPEGSTCWSIHVITPTAHPLESLAVSLTREAESVTAAATLIDDLARDPRSLHLAVLRLLSRSPSPVTTGEGRGGNHLLLVVDQFEELFSLCRSETERKAFVDNLLHAAVPSPVIMEEGWGGGDGPTIVVVVLRADFYAHCAPFEDLRQTVCQRQEYIGAMNAEELRRAIEEPARRGGWAFELGLVDLLLRDAGDEPGALPLLSHALLETWQRRRGRTLTLAGYAESGGVRGAIARTAETTFNQLTREQQAVARNIFLRLTELGEGTQDTRRRVALAELIPRPEDAPAVQAVLKKLADARLITTAEGTAEVAHEALIREWATLREWLDENREGLRLHRQLTQAAQEWDKLNRDVGALYRGVRLAQAVEWADAHADDLNVLERAFLDASLAERQAQQEAEAARQRRELETAQTLAEAQRQRAETEKRRAEEQAQAASKLRQRAVFLTLALGASIVLLLVAVWLGQLANRNARAAQEQTRLATSRELAAAAVNNLQVDPERSVLLALQALDKADTLEARNSLHQALPELHILRTIPAHKQAPGVAFSPDGTRLASMGVDGTAKVWDASTGQELLTLPGEPGDSGLVVAFSPDGKLLATFSTTKVVVWDAASGQKLFTLAGKSIGPTITHIGFSPDGQRLAVANMDGAPKVWDLSTRAEVFSLTGHEQPCDGIAYSPDGKRLATGDEEGVAKIWDAATGQELLTLRQSGVLHSVAFSPDGARLASANEDGTLKVWDPATGKELLSLRYKSGLYDVAFMPDGKRLVTAHQDGTVQVWDAVSGQQLLTLAGHVSTVVGVAVSPDGKRIATGGYDGTVRIWEAAPGWELLTLAAHDDQVYDAVYSPDGTRLGTVSLDGTAKLWDPVSGQMVLSLTPGSLAGGLTGLAFSPDGQRLATGSLAGPVNIWDIGTGQAVMTLTGHTSMVPGLAFSPDGQRLASVSWDGTVKVWDLASGREVVTFAEHLKAMQGFPPILFSVAFSPDGKRVFTGGTDGYVREWDSTTGQELQTFSGEELEIYGIALSPSGKLLTMGRQDGVVTVWDVASGEKLLQLSGHAGLISRLAFNQAETRLASASFDGFAKVWDVQTGQELMTLYGNTSNVFGVSFSPDGTRLATAGGDGTARVYTLQMEDLVKLARSRVTRSLTTEECRRYLHAETCPATP